MLELVISDQRPQFVVKMMKELNEMLEISTKLLTAYQPQMDGQTKRTNQKLEQYLKIFVNYRQEAWPEWIATAEFAYNNKIQILT